MKVYQEWTLWLAGTYALTNRMLSDLRAAGYAHGYRNAMAKRGRVAFPTQPVVDRFALECQRIRNDVNLLARSSRIFDRRDFGRRCALRVFAFGHPKLDADAPLLAAKAISDGFSDAGVFRHDGQDCLWTQVGSAWCQPYAEAVCAKWSRRVGSGTGLLVVLQEVSAWSL